MQKHKAESNKFMDFFGGSDLNENWAVFVELNNNQESYQSVIFTHMLLHVV